MKSQDSPHKPSQSNQTKDYDQLVAEAYERIQQNKRKKKQEELRLAKRQLRDPNITEEQFESALRDLKLLVKRIAPQRTLVEKAYARLSAKDKRRVRYSMLNFYYLLDDYATARHFLPKRFKGFGVRLCVGHLEQAGRQGIPEKTLESHDLEILVHSLPLQPQRGACESRQLLPQKRRMAAGGGDLP